MEFPLAATFYYLQFQAAVSDGRLVEAQVQPYNRIGEMLLKDNGMWPNAIV